MAYNQRRAFLVAVITVITGRVGVGVGLPFMFLIFGPVFVFAMLPVPLVFVPVSVVPGGGGGGGFSSEGGEVGHRASPSKRAVVACMI